MRRRAPMMRMRGIRCKTVRNQKQATGLRKRASPWKTLRMTQIKALALVQSCALMIMREQIQELMRKRYVSDMRNRPARHRPARPARHVPWLLISRYPLIMMRSGSTQGNWCELLYATQPASRSGSPQHQIPTSPLAPGRGRLQRRQLQKHYYSSTTASPARLRTSPLRLRLHAHLPALRLMRLRPCTHSTTLPCSPQNSSKPHGFSA
jgi:hypothetical protein